MTTTAPSRSSITKKNHPNVAKTGISAAQTAIPALLKAKNDPVEFVRNAADEAVKKIAGAN